MGKNLGCKRGPRKAVFLYSNKLSRTEQVSGEFEMQGKAIVPSRGAVAGISSFSLT